VTDEFLSLGWTVRPRRCRPYARRSPSGALRGGCSAATRPRSAWLPVAYRESAVSRHRMVLSVWLSTPMVLRSGCLHPVATVPSFFCCHDLGLDSPRVSGLVVTR
jgi:hypothetical protein